MEPYWFLFQVARQNLVEKSTPLWYNAGNLRCFGVKTILFRKKEPILGTVKFNAEINTVKGEGKDLRDEVAKLKKRSDEITKELTKDR